MTANGIGGIAIASRNTAAVSSRVWMKRAFSPSLQFWKEHIAVMTLLDVIHESKDWVQRVEFRPKT
jgi:hypothetical protein